MKKIAIISVLLVLYWGPLIANSIKSADRSKLINPDNSLVTSFKETFPFAENVKWLEDTVGPVVNFSYNGIKARVNYDKDNNYINSLRYYDESNLPLNILMAIHKRFKDKTIYLVTELSDMNGIQYYVKLEDNRNWYTIKATPYAQIEVIERFKKQIVSPKQ